MTLEDVRVLLVEDNPADARWLQIAVAEVTAGRRIRLIHVDCLERALECLEQESFDVVLLDLSLPDGAGLETLLRTRAKARAVPILILSGLDDEALAVKAVRAGAQDYLVKGQMDGHLIVRAMRYAIERRHALEALERREQHFRSLIENALDLISILNQDGTIRYVSPSHERILGYRPEELVGMHVAKFVHRQDIPDLNGALRAKTGSLEVRFRHKNGSWRVLEAFGRDLMHLPGVQGVVVNSRDVTERKHVEEALREANQTLRAVINTSPLPIYSSDLQGRVKSWNRAAQRAFGWSEGELLDRPLPHLLEPEAALPKRLERAQGGDPETGFEIRCRRRDGSVMDATIWSAPISDGAGAPRGIVDVVADVTEKKRLEEQLNHSQRLEAVGRLAGGVAHDFNNLLMIISGYSDMLLETLRAGDPAREDVKEIARAAERAADLTKRLLAFGSGQAASPQTLDLNALVRDMDRMLRRVIGEDIDFITRLDDGLKAVRADPGQLEQVVLNLALNARDAMPDGGRLTIETAHVRIDEEYARKNASPPPGDYSLLTVADTGVGIHPQAQPRLFEPFFTTKEKGKGTGLGLSTSYGIVKQNGGEILFQSQAGGTTFRIYLPAVDQTPQRIESRRESPILRGAETILLVEDEDAVRRVLEAMLRRNGYDVLSASSPAKAADLACRHQGRLHLLITDMVMPGMSGRELAREVMAAHPDLPVIFMSGHAELAGEPKPAAFLQKPFSPEALAVKVREVLTLRANAAPPAPPVS